jgi:NitT/TauT family transport system permease protein
VAAASLRTALSSLPVFVVAIAFLIVWQLGVKLSGIHPILLPGPGAVARAAWENRRALLEATWITGQAALAGFLLSVVVGFLVALLFSQSRHIRRALFPYVIFLQTVPIIAIAPLLINWFGYEFMTVVYITVIISLFPIISNVTAGLITPATEHASLFQIYHAGRWSTLTKLRIPSALPNLLLGMRISSGLAVVGAIIGDFFVGSGAEYNGLGTLMTEWGALQKTGDLIGTLAAATLLGVVFFAGVNLLAWALRRRWGT